MDVNHDGKGKVLLDLEDDCKDYSASSIESKFLVCRKDDVLKPKTATTKDFLPDKKPNICALPESEVLGKVKDFLGVISEANKSLQFNAKDNPEKYDIEVLSGNESEYIELDLMLGVADLHTPEAVAAAESAIAGNQPEIYLAASISDDDEDTDEESDDEETIAENAGVNSSSKKSRDKSSRKRQKIIELS